MFPLEQSARALIRICRTVSQSDFSLGSDEGRLVAALTPARIRDETLTDT